MVKLFKNYIKDSRKVLRAQEAFSDKHWLDDMIIWVVMTVGMIGCGFVIVKVLPKAA